METVLNALVSIQIWTLVWLKISTSLKIDIEKYNNQYKEKKSIIKTQTNIW